MDNTSDNATISPMSYVEYINRLPGVISSDVVLDGDNICEVHVLSDSSRMPKQVARDVQSVFHARFHTSIDHKIISIAQIDIPSAKSAVAGRNQAPPASVLVSQARPAIEEIGIFKRQNDTEIKVELSYLGSHYFSTQSCSSDKTDYYRSIAQATLRAVSQALNDSRSFTVLDVRLSEIANDTVVLVCVSLSSEGCSKRFCGSAFITDDRETAVVKATLNSVNRLKRCD